MTDCPALTAVGLYSLRVQRRGFLLIATQIIENKYPAVNARLWLFCGIFEFLSVYHYRLHVVFCPFRQ